MPGYLFGMAKTSVDWEFYANATVACKLANYSSCFLPRGKMLGGSSSINYMAYVRGIEDDFDEWSKLGNRGWDYENVLPYFKKFEGNQNASFVAYDNGRYHSATGPFKVESLVVPTFEKVYIQALKDAGVHFIPDINSDQKLGYTILQATSFEGRRTSTASAFLTPVKNRPNLHVIKHGFVTKILIDKKNVARGVELVYNGKHLMKVYAKKEVIISAGTIQSPPLLMRSGIGPKDELRKHNIPVKANLAVGENYIDHVYVGLGFAFNVSEAPSPLVQLDSLYQYLVHNSGPLSSMAFISAHIDTLNKTGIPDIQLLAGYFPRGAPESTIINFNKYSGFDQILDGFIETNKKFDIMMVVVALIKPKSRGVVTLNEHSIWRKAAITSNYLTDKNDRATMIRGIKDQIALINTPPFQKIGGTFMRIPIPECDKLKYQSDEYWDCYISYTSIAGSHQVGTCKMGIDPKAVVDPLLKVHIVKKLMQCDAGV